MLTDKKLITNRRWLGGEQRIYRLDNGYGLSLVNSPEIRSYPFAWEAAVLKNVSQDGTKYEITYDTPLTDDVEVFLSDSETNAFLEKAFTVLANPFSPTFWQRVLVAIRNSRNRKK